MKYLFRREMKICTSSNALFAQFRDTNNLPLILPPWLQITSDTRPVSGGDTLHYRLCVHGIPFHWTTRIDSWNPPYSFVDRQITGPYHSWVYEHDFHERKGQTLAVDTIHYDLPGGFLGDFVQRFAQYELERIFDHRERQLNNLFPRRR